jgi:hypothetical protein
MSFEFFPSTSIFCWVRLQTLCPTLMTWLVESDFPDPGPVILMVANIVVLDSGYAPGRNLYSELVYALLSRIRS